MTDLRWLDDGRYRSRHRLPVEAARLSRETAWRSARARSSGNIVDAAHVFAGVPHDPTTEPRTAADVVFYWRPGCGFCSRLHRELSLAGVAMDERNIWEDGEAASAVRAAAGGNETVPTVVVGGVAMVNPSGAKVLAQLQRAGS